MDLFLQLKSISLNYVYEKTEKRYVKVKEKQAGG